MIGTADEEIVARVAGKRIVAGTTEQLVVPLATRCAVIAGLAA